MNRLFSCLLFSALVFTPAVVWGQDDLYGPKEKKENKKEVKKEQVPEIMANTQDMPDSLDRWAYCEILGTQKFLSTKVTVTIDYGQHKNWFSDHRIRDEEGKVKTFNSMIDAMNYLGNQGWEFVQAYVATEGNQNVYHWLLKADRRNPIFLPQTRK